MVVLKRSGMFKNIHKNGHANGQERWTLRNENGGKRPRFEMFGMVNLRNSFLGFGDSF